MAASVGTSHHPEIPKSQFLLAMQVAGRNSYFGGPERLKPDGGQPL